jgi:hypothetical protein
MERSKEIFAIIREELFNEIPSEMRQQFSHIEVRESNEWETHRNDPIYCKLKKAEKEAKKELQTYLYNKRHSITKNK